MIKNPAERRDCRLAAGHSRRPGPGVPGGAGRVLGPGCAAELRDAQLGILYRRPKIDVEPVRKLVKRRFGRLAIASTCPRRSWTHRGVALR